MMKRGKEEEKRYYKIPVDISRLFREGERLEMCGELESIDQFLALLLTTHPGEHSFDRNFGMKLWELDFENVVSLSDWTERFIGYIREAVEKYEKRLNDVEVTVDARDVAREDALLDTVTIRKQVDVVIAGVVASTGKRYGFSHVVYLGPLSRA